MKILASILLTSLLCFTAACNDDEIDSDTEARWAYLGFDMAVDKALNLGFDGYNSASSANIDDQNGVGDIEGTMVVSGQVDQGSSDNKEMRLLVTLVDYNDGEFLDTNTEDDELYEVVYNTPVEAPLNLELSLRNIPNGTFTGTLIGTAYFSGPDIESEGDFNLMLAGAIQEDPNDPTRIVRTPGSLTITGTVTSDDGIYNVDVQR